jgi:hypothetical protein
VRVDGERKLQIRKDFQKFKGKFLKNPEKLLEWEVRHVPRPATAKERGKHFMGDNELTTIARTGLALLSIGIFLFPPCKQSLAMHGRRMMTSQCSS